MAKPINDREFDGYFNAVANLGAGDVSVTIVKQASDKSYFVTDGTTTMRCFLVNKADATLLEGEMNMTVYDEGSTAFYVEKLMHQTLRYWDTNGDLVRAKWMRGEFADDANGIVGFVDL